MNALVHNFFNVEVMVRAHVLLLMGLRVTVELGVTSLVFAILLGVLLASLWQLRNRFLNTLIRVYADFFRAMPTIVLFILVYFALPFIGIAMPAFLAAVVTLVLNGGAYFEEIFRGGIESIDIGQTEAARSLGLNFLQIMRYVILPQAIRVVLPPATTNSLELIKTTVLASVIALPELLKQAEQSQGLFANPTPLVEAALIFLMLLWPLVRLSGYLERRMSR